MKKKRSSVLAREKNASCGTESTVPRAQKVCVYRMEWWGKFLVRFLSLSSIATLEKIKKSENPLKAEAWIDHPHISIPELFAGWKATGCGTTGRGSLRSLLGLVHNYFPLVWIHASLYREGLGQCGEQEHRELDL